MTLLFVRFFFFVLSLILGAQIGLIYQQPQLGIVAGGGTALILISIESALRKISVRGLSSMVFGLLLGVIMAKLIADIMQLLPLGEVLQSVLRVVLTVIFSYLGTVMALRGKDEFNIIIPYVRFRRQDLKEDVIIMDTSAIIDGRVSDIYKTGFLAGRLVIPRFVLQELQQLSDSHDETKRQRGRRGLETVQLMQQDPGVDVKVHEDDFSNQEAVDLKLIRLAKMLGARLLTTDFNLSRLAAIQDVETLNMNSLMSAVKAVVFAGDVLDVRLTKEGKEIHQAVGYLDDGTMVVVSEARALIGQKVKATVTSSLQTQSGRMIFAKI